MNVAENICLSQFGQDGHRGHCGIEIRERSNVFCRVSPSLPRDADQSIVVFSLYAHAFLLNLRKSQLFLFPGAGFSDTKTGCAFGSTDVPVGGDPTVPGTGFFTIREPVDLGPTVNAAG